MVFFVPMAFCQLGRHCGVAVDLMAVCLMELFLRQSPRVGGNPRIETLNDFQGRFHRQSGIRQDRPYVFIKCRDGRVVLRQRQFHPDIYVQLGIRNMMDELPDRPCPFPVRFIQILAAQPVHRLFSRAGNVSMSFNHSCTCSNVMGSGIWSSPIGYLTSIFLIPFTF